MARQWTPPSVQTREQEILASVAGSSAADLVARIEALAVENRSIHDRECINLNPATNVMNPRAEALLAAGLGSRPSLGYAGEKYEMGLEAIEQIEVIAADLACRVFRAAHAEVRVASGAMANLYAFMATCSPGDTIIVPPPSIGGHVTHNTAGAAGLYGVRIVEAPIDPHRYTVDVDALAALAARVRPRLITIGASLNLVSHPVAEVAEIARANGCPLLFDAAHACGMIAGDAWPNPLHEGADLMTMSTYKSLGGPAGGLIVTNRADLAERLDAIAYPGLTANFDAGRVAALAVTLTDWLTHGTAYAATMRATSRALAGALAASDLPVFGAHIGYTDSYQFALDASEWGGGHAAALRLRDANILSCAIGLPGLGSMAGLRLGTPEVVRWGMTADEMPELAGLVVDGLRHEPGSVAQRTTDLRRRFTSLHFIG